MALAAALLAAVVSTAARGQVTVGLHFVDGADEPIDFLTIPGFPPFNFIQPWQLTDPANQFVLDGAFAGVTEQQARDAIVAEVKDKYYSIPTPTGYVLDVEFLPHEVTGPGSVNVIIGQHNVGTQTWFGYASEGGGFGANGANNAAVSADRIDALLTVDFVQFTDAVNAVANVVAHEAAHLFWLDHVWADARADLGWSGEPVVTNPYDVMATGPSGLPDAGWLDDNVFTTVANTQSGGHSSVSLLIDQLGLRRIGDTDLDGDVDNADLGAAAGSFTGSGATGSVWADGDVDFDGDVDNADLGAVAGAFTGALAGSAADPASAAAALLYDPATGSVALDATEAAGGVITSYQIETADGAFALAGYLGPVGGAFAGALEDISPTAIGDTDLSLVGFDGLAELGSILPTGLDLAGLRAYLSNAVYVGEPGSGQLGFDLVVVPEPASLALLGLGALRIARRRRM